MNAYRGMTRMLALLMIALGVAMVAVTFHTGSRTGVGVVIGLLFVGLGIGRLYLLRGGRR